MTYLLSTTHAALERGADGEPESSRRATVSSHLATLVPLFGEALDGGAPRTLHAPAAVHRLAERLAAEACALEAEPDTCDAWFLGEVRKLVELFAHASARGECVLVINPRP
jgi:hypothetical protein